MKKRTGILSCILILNLVTLPGCGFSSSFQDLCRKARTLQEYSYTVVSTHDNVTSQFRLYVKADKIRLENSDPTLGEWIAIYDLKTNESVSWYSAQKIGQKGRITPDQIKKIPTPGNLLSGIDSARVKKIGGVEMDGKDAIIFEFEDRGGPARIWLWEENGMPLRLEGLGSENQQTFIFQDIKVSPDDMGFFSTLFDRIWSEFGTSSYGYVDDSLFQVPGDVVIRG